jgi:hypothetical protein
VTLDTLSLTFGKTYLERGQPVTVITKWNGKGPRNVLIQPTVTKLAEDRAEQLKRDPDKVVQELDKRCLAGDSAHRPVYQRRFALG